MAMNSVNTSVPPTGATEPPSVTKTYDKAPIMPRMDNGPVETELYARRHNCRWQDNYGHPQCSTPSQIASHFKNYPWEKTSPFSITT
eukprot:3036302-Ditylum_brightwellii.AAC.1